VQKLEFVFFPILLTCKSFWQIIFSRYTFFKLFPRGGDRGRPPFRGRGRGWVRGLGDARGRGRGQNYEYGQRRGGGQYY
jgi:hypothetical protein